MSDEFHDYLDTNVLGFTRFKFEKCRKDLHGFCQSPIEKQFVDGFLVTGHFCDPELPAIIRPGNEFDSDHPFQIAPQYAVDPYRVDFAVLYRDSGQEVRVVIECDGHAFHEKTKEQAARDKRRDRDLNFEGWRVLRFTGSELHRDRFACGSEVSELIFSIINRAAEKGRQK